MTASRTRTILYGIAAITSLAGLTEAIYLTVLHLSGETAVCGDSSGCFRVLGSAYAHIGRIPVAAVGMLGYFGAFSFATFAAFGYLQARKLFPLMVGAMFIATLWLLFVQAFLLHAFCRYCLISAALILSLSVLAVMTLRSE